MRQFSPFCGLWLFILWMNTEKSLQQNEVRCRLTLPPLEGTMYEPTDRSVFSSGDTVRVTCGSGHWISNPQNTSAVITCNDDGDWSVEPECQEFLCSNPQDPLVHFWDVELGQHRKFGEYANYRCKSGYKRTNGIPRAICTRDGWRPNPLCQEITCDRQDIQNAHIVTNNKPKYKYSERVNYVCPDGYQGSVTLTCGENGWTRDSQCTATHCPVIHVDNNVLVNGSLERAALGNVVRFSCKSNTDILFGPTEIYCDESGLWSGDAPKCKDIKCEAPKIENGIVHGNIREYDEHEVLHFSCIDKYKRTEDRPSTCTKIGLRAEWSPTPMCEPVKCRLTLPPLEGTSYEPAYRNVFTPDEQVTVTCGKKYWISSPRDISAVTTCTDTGEWTVRPICKEVTCSNQRDRHVYTWDVYWGQKITLGDTARYRCRSNYKSPDGSYIAKCTRDGWRPNPLCQEIICERQDIPHANIVSRNWRYKNNEVANYVCEEGYGGSPTRTCGENGWTGDSQCTEIICDRQDILHANIVNGKWRYKYNEQANYECEEGYRGSPTRTCGEYGWTGNSQCTEITCKREDISHANIVNSKWSYKYNEVAKYECLEGYGGSPTRTCGENGWTGDSQCTEILCVKPDIQDADITSNKKERYRHSEQVQFECKNGAGKHFTVTCKHGNWTGIQSCAACPKPDVPNGFVKVRKDNYVLSYTCNPGYKLYTNGWWGEAKCLGSEWSGLESAQCIEETKCGEIPAIPHAEMEHEHRAYEQNESIPIICKTGYQAQDDRLICQGGKWTLNGTSLETSTLPHVCAPSSNPCSQPPRIENAVVKSSYQQKFLSGSVVTYQCRAEYTMDEGNTGTLECVNGEWENKSIICTSLPASKK